MDDDELLRRSFGALREADRPPPFARVASARPARWRAPAIAAAIAVAAAVLLWIGSRPRRIEILWIEPERTLAALRAPEAGSVFAEARVPGEEER